MVDNVNAQVQQLLIGPLGSLFIYELMKKAGIMPLCERDLEDKENV